MALEWLRRDYELKNHSLHASEHFGDVAPSVIYERRPVIDPHGQVVSKLYAAWISLNNPAQFNSYTTGMLKGLVAGFQNASSDREVVAVVLTGVGTKAFCTGGNIADFAAYYARRPNEYGEYMDLFISLIDAILNCKKPVISRVNGIRVGGGQEMGLATDMSISSDLAVFGQASAKHGSAPDGGTSDMLPWFLGIEDAMYNCATGETWSAYKMKAKNLLTKVVPVLVEDGRWIRNPLVRTDTVVDDGEIVYGEPVPAAKIEAAKETMARCAIDFSQLDVAVNEQVWKFTNLFPHCLMKSIDGIRGKKKFFWDQMKLANRHWLAANMNHEAWLGFSAFDSRKLTGTDVIDFVKYRQLIAGGAVFDEHLAEQVLKQPK